VGFSLRRSLQSFILSLDMKKISVLLAILFFPIAAAFSQLAPLRPDGFVTLQEIVDDFAKSEDQALQKYNGMRICVYGRVGQVAQDADASGGPLTVYLQLPSRNTPDVKAVFDGDYLGKSIVNVDNDGSKATVYHCNWEGELSRERSFLVVGENTAVRGTFDNFLAGDIILKNSFKLSPVAMMNKLKEHGLFTE
jgi:hypothetical protein